MGYNEKARRIINTIELGMKHYNYDSEIARKLLFAKVIEDIESILNTPLTEEAEHSHSDRTKKALYALIKHALQNTTLSVIDVELTTTYLASSLYDKLSVGLMQHEDTKKPHKKHDEIMTKWWPLKYDGYVRVIGYYPHIPTGKCYRIANKYVDISYFDNLEGVDIPPEGK